jgi:hypothetical protein
MNVHIDFLEWRLDEQQRRRVNAVRQDRSISFRERAANHAIANETSIHEEIL